MNGKPHTSQDNQFVNKDNKPVYIQGSVSSLGSRLSGRAIDDVKPKSEIIIKTSKLRRPLSSPGYFQAILIHSGPDRSVNNKRKRFGKTHLIIFSAAAALLIMGGYFTYIGVTTVKASNLQGASLAGLSSQGSSTASSNPSSGLSTVKVTASDLENYKVAPNLPRYLKIPSINVNARVLSVGLNKDGSIGTPTDIYDTAWYNGSAQPGQPGATVIDGHVSGWSAHGVFYGLKNLSVGDNITIERGDGTILNYKVVKTQIYPSNNVNMKAVMSPIVNGQHGLNLITCTGEVLPGSSRYNERLVVFATQS